MIVTDSRTKEGTVRARINELYPGATPAGEEVEVLSMSRISANIRVGRRVVKVSPKWIDVQQPTEPFTPRRLRRGGGFCESIRQS